MLTYSQNHSIRLFLLLLFFYFKKKKKEERDSFQLQYVKTFILEFEIKPLKKTILAPQTIKVMLQPNCHVEKKKLNSTIGLMNSIKKCSEIHE